MKFETKEGERLKRLAREYAQACVAKSWIGNYDPKDHNIIIERYQKAKKKLYDEINRLTMIDDTPRAISEGYGLSDMDY